MGKLKNNQKGFTVVESLLIIIILILIGFAGWFIYHTDHKTTTVSTSQSTVSSTKPSMTSVIKIPELGVEMTVPIAFKTLIYTVIQQPSVNGEKNISVGFSTPTLDAAVKGCSPSNSPLGTLYKTDGQYPANPTDDNSSGILVKQYPNFYIAYMPKQQDCANPNDTNAINIEDNTPTLVKSETNASGQPLLDFTVQLLQ